MRSEVKQYDGGYLDSPCVVSPPDFRPVEMLNDRVDASGLNLLSMSDTFKTIQTYSKHRYFTANQVLCKTQVADWVLLGEVI